MSIKIVNTGYS
jgi:hypothetical protein